MADPSVTVVIPTYNRPHFLEEALASVLAQDYTDFAVLVSDNASPCDIAGLIASFADPRIQLIERSVNIGIQLNWRTALQAPHTTYVAVLEDDDLWLPHHLGDAVAALDAEPEATFYNCATRLFGDCEDDFRPDWFMTEGLAAYRWQAAGYGAWLRGCPVMASSVVIRRQAMDGLFWGGKSWPWCDDYMWWGQLALRGAVLFDAKLGARHRYHQSNWTNQTWNNRGKAEWLYTLRYLATQAWAAGALRDLAAETRDFPAAALSVLVIALTAPETPAPLREQARRIFRARPDIVGAEGCAVQYRIASHIGDWWLNFADLSTRLLGRWWPVVAY